MESLEHLETVGGGEGRRNISVFRQIQILTAKNWKTKRRTETKKLLGELLVPVLYLFILSFLVKLDGHKEYPEVTEEREIPRNVLESLLEENPNVVYVVHSSEERRERVGVLMKKVLNESDEALLLAATDEILKIVFLSSEAELLKTYAEKDVPIAVILSEKKDFEYTIRVDPDKFQFPSLKIKKLGLETCRGLNNFSNYMESQLTCPMNGYFYSNFLAVQHLMDNVLIMEKQGGARKVPNVRVGNYPKPKYSTGMSTLLRVIIPLYCIIPLAQLINTLLLMIVSEKENKIKDGLKMIGVSDFSYWFSWFAIYGAMSFVFAVMFTIVMHYMQVLRNTNFLIIFFLFMLFGCSIITFSFGLSPFFHKPKTAGAVGTLVMQFSGTLFMLQTFLFDPSSPVIMPLRLISSVAFTTALDTACSYEYSDGISLQDILPGNKGSGILYSILFLVFDTFLYGCIAIYLDNVIPNEYGVNKHPLYFLSFLNWRGSGDPSKANVLPAEDMDDISDEILSENSEKVHPSLLGKEAFRIRKLRKTFSSWTSKTKTEAVKEVSLDIYEGQIFALLGRNGAGKSTLMNMITGLIMPTGGRCTVFGLDIAKPQDMMKLRKMTGVCMQQDLHFLALTVEEHLLFYGRLRGVPKLELLQEINELLLELELSQQRHVNASKLSGGQKRKLSVAISLVGSPRIIILDEPSAGVDPVSRRQLWKVLQRKKEGRVILLTTHFMDEADILADRKAIINEGVLKCVGSSIFLKNRFGVGYQLTFEMDENQTIFNPSFAHSLVQKWIPDAAKSRQIIANEIKYMLPHTEVSKFSDLFRDIEHLIASKSTSINSYGVSMTTLSEVFLKMSNDVYDADPRKPHSMPHRRSSTMSSASLSSHGSKEEFSSMDPQGDNLIPDFGITSPEIVAVFFSLCLLRCRRLIRNPQSLFFMIVMPVLFVAISFAIIKSRTVGDTETSIILSMNNFTGFYSKEDLGIAVDDGSKQSLAYFFNNSMATAVAYSGIFKDLLYLRPPLGTMSALKISPENGAQIWMNGTFPHAPGLQSIFGTPSPVITTFNHPLPSKTVVNLDPSTFYAAFLIGPAFTFSAIGMVIEIVNDREKKTKSQLRVNGLSFAMYFSSVLFVFFILSLLIILMEISVIFSFNITAYTNPYAMTVSACLLLLFIFPCLLFSAAFSYFFERTETAQSVFSQVCSWMGSIVGIAIILIDSLAPKHSMMAHTIFSFLDIFYIPFGIFYFVQKQYIRCTVLDTCSELSFKDYTGREFVVMAIAMLVQIPIYAIWLVVADVYKNEGSVATVLTKIFRLRPKASVSPVSSCVLNTVEDEDVKQESAKVTEYFNSQADSNSKCVVAVQDLKKTYLFKKGQNKVTTVKQVLQGVDLMVEEGEVFGLLGHNGAGKTTTINLINAEEKPDSGKIRLCGHDITSNLSEAFQKLGYCPQHDALWDNITLREHIELYTVIRGVAPNIRRKVVNHFLKGLQVEEHADKKTNILSGGTKRKLMYCMSIIGAPRIVLLDEPSTGMDIVSKRFLWNTVIGTFKEKRGAILTSHSMEEVEALCTRIGILVKGSLLCIGSSQHLKTKFGIGYNLEIKLKADDSSFSYGQYEFQSTWEDKFAFVHRYFPEGILSEKFENRAVYSLPKSSINSIAQTFSLLQDIKSEYNIEEYSFSQTTLEQVFLQFQTTEDDDSNNE